MWPTLSGLSKLHRWLNRWKRRICFCSFLCTLKDSETLNMSNLGTWKICQHIALSCCILIDIQRYKWKCWSKFGFSWNMEVTYLTSLRTFSTPPGWFLTHSNQTPLDMFICGSVTPYISISWIATSHVHIYIYKYIYNVFMAQFHISALCWFINPSKKFDTSRHPIVSRVK